MEKRVLITGVTGFAGRYLSDYLIQQGFKVSGTGNSNPAQEAQGIDLYSIDLRHSSEIEEVVNRVKPTHVVHLAAISYVAHGDVKEIYETNIVGSRNLLHALSNLSSKPQSVLLTSSANVYGNSTNEILTETDPLQPANDYAVSKVAMELMSRQFADDLPLIVVRPFNFTGRGQSTNFLIPKIVSHFRARAEYIELGNVDVSRDFSDVRTIVRYMGELLMSRNISGETINICSGRPQSLLGIIETCARLSGHKIEIKTNPLFQRANEIKVLIGNANKLREIVSVGPHVSFDETLEWMLTDTD